MWVWLAVAEAKKPVAPPEPPPLAAVASALVGRALISTEAYDDLGELCDGIGHRLSGSAALDRAIDWAQEKMRGDGLVVRAEPVTVPVWVRGEERGEMLAPLQRPLNLKALGGSVGTPPGGLEADVVVVDSFEQLAARKTEIAGRIVLFDVPFTNYGATVAYRGGGPAAAAKLGAVGALVRSVTPSSLDTPHTGATRDPEGAAPIPSAAVTVESASQIRRMVARGETVRVRLTLGAHRLPDAPSANVVGEVPGRTDPEEVVVLACHLDSWDVGQGAQDDGAGCVTVMQAAHLIAALPVRPKRTVRVVLYTNEENGLAGGKAYALAHAGESHAAALEVDTGAGQPLGFGLTRGDGVSVDADIAALAPVAALLQPLGAGHVAPGHGGADIGPLTERGVLSLGLEQDTTGYWPIHHTDADTFDKVDPTLLAKNVAAVAVMAWALAER